MASDLATAIQGLHLEDLPDSNIDDILFQQRPSKRVKQDTSELKTSLETDFLMPCMKFSPEWLNGLQQYALQTPTNSAFHIH